MEEEWAIRAKTAEMAREKTLPFIWPLAYLDLPIIASVVKVKKTACEYVHW